MSKRLLLLGATLVATLTGLDAGLAARAVAPPKPSSFTARVDNLWFPLRPGSSYVYRGVKEGHAARDVLRVTRSTETVDGVTCVVVAHHLYLDGRLSDASTAWYAQDSHGNVWYFGETGSFKAGVDGAKPGISMPAHPRVGEMGQLGFYKGRAEDHFQVLSVHATVKVPYTSSRQTLLIKEWSPLEPGLVDHKFYVRGIGTVLEQNASGSNERLELVSFRRGS